MFRIELGEDEYVEATLIEAEPYTAAPGGGNAGSSFSLLFALPGEDTLEQRIYSIDHEQLGELKLFMVPVGPGRMESVFN